MSAIRDIFAEVQRSTQTHKLCVKKLAAAINSRGPQDKENISYFLQGGIDRILLHPSGGAAMERSISFLGTFLATVDESVLTITMKHICSRLQSSNKLVRQRVCQMASNTLESLVEAKIDPPAEVFEVMSNSVISRLKDKIPAVRIAAMKALRFLQTPSDENDPCTLEIKRCMRCDTSAAVRAAAVDVVVLNEYSKHDLCDRLKDVKSDVRVAVLRRLAAETEARQFTAQMRAEILRTALEDREEIVRSAVVDLIWKWLSIVNENIPAVLKLLNPAENEEAVLLVGATIMEELVKSETSQHSKVKKTLKEICFKWKEIANDGTVTQLSPSDVLWVQIRCSYARQFLPVFPASEICDALLPDASVLCTLLKDLKTTLVNPAVHHPKQSSLLKAQSMVKYLHNLAPLLIGSTDVSGLTQLKEDCADTFLNTSVTLPWEAVEASLRSYSELHIASSSDANDAPAHRVVLDMAASLREQMVAIGASDSKMDEGEEGGELDPAVIQKLVLAMTERGLQLTHWALQQELSFAACKPVATPPVNKGSEESEENEDEDSTTETSVAADVLPFVLESLQKPQYQLRFLAVSCLGLICLLDAKLCQSYRGLILQVASGDFEDHSIRAQALQCLVDFSAVHRSSYIDDSDIANVLLRMQESGEPDAMLVAAEAATKLLHSGTHHEPRLFANLLKFFFLTESLPGAAAPAGQLTPSTGNEEEDLAAAQEAYERRIFLANCARLQQVLSIFFHLFTTSDVVADHVVADAIPYLVAEMTNEIKDGTVDPSALSKILKHLFSLCENKSASAASETSATSTPPVDDEESNAVHNAVPSDDNASVAAGAGSNNNLMNLVRAHTAAALSKELLKLGNCKIDKAVGKEYVKLLSTLSFESWIAQYDVAAVERVVDTITLCCAHDRTAAKYLEQVMQICVSPALHEPALTPSPVAFANLAPGLTDLVELAARSSVLDMSMDEGASICGDDQSMGEGGMRSLPSSAMKQPRRSRNPLSAVKPVPRSAAKPVRGSTARATRARLSYAEQDSESEEENLDEADAESSSGESSESDADSHSSDGDAGEVDTAQEASADIDVRHATMSPTKQFIMNAKGKTGVRGKASATVKKVDTSDAGGGMGKGKVRATRSRNSSAIDENVVPN